MDNDAATAEYLTRLWAPWRIQYIRHAKSTECVLCAAPADGNDEKNLILFRGELNFIIMNAFPYSPGHLMVAPFRHTADLEAVTAEESAEHQKLIKLGIALLRRAINPEGFNVGLNLGRVAGAGIDQHLHTHIVPRWFGDTNFMPVLTGTRVLSESLISMYQRLKVALAQDPAFGSTEPVG